MTKYKGGQLCLPGPDLTPYSGLTFDNDLNRIKGWLSEPISSHALIDPAIRAGDTGEVEIGIVRGSQARRQLGVLR